MKKLFSFLFVFALIAALFAGCGATPAGSGPVSAASSSDNGTAAPRTTFRIAGMKGPTTMGMVKLMSDADSGTARHDYQVEIVGTADAITGRLIQGELDAAMLPANVASVLYNQSGGKVQVAAVNTLGVLYIVEAGNAIQSIEDLRGKTLYATGKGQTPEYVLNYILRENGLDPDTDLTIEYKSEATEVAALLKNTPGAVALLPQPYVTAVQMQVEGLRMALDMTAEWTKVNPDSALVTGVLVVRTEFAAENTAAVNEFLEDYRASIEFVQANTAEAAALVAQYGIVEQAAMAEKALPYCGITYVDGAEMRQMLLGYLQVLFDQRPESVGGKLPEDSFFYGL